ncbi:MAG: sorbosone dehydrogenase family protein [Myxacorys californica WJT36-NPBG1]|jgi:glucose/arabinose dehydrogenase|nr:sorbosone dehydrogenase family protein [Myxacorys californica WJT36-NPBG1]
MHYFFRNQAISHRLLILLLLIAPLAACNSSNTALTPPADSKETQPQAVPQRSIQTEVLTPQPIRVGLDQLPQPYTSDSASKPPNVIPIPANPTLRVPEGFTVNVFADKLERPRWLALTPNGDVLVTETRQNRILLLKDKNSDGVSDAQSVFATAENGLNLPFGMTFGSNSFYVGNTNAVIRFPYTQGQEKVTGRGETITELPGQGYNQHWTRNVVVSPDGQKLYVSVGSQSNAEEEPLPRASIQVMNLDGSDRQTFASGLRNPVGLDFSPLTNQLYATVNERDELGDNLVPDYLTQVQSGEFYGFPYAYLSPDRLDPRHVENGKSIRPELAAKTRTPDVLFEAHSAALGLKFYNGSTFPEKYRNGAFVAFRGSWNRNQGTGYKLVYVPFTAEGRSQGYYEDFLTGFLVDPSEPITWGRPVGLVTMRDGSLLFTDEANNRIYRVQYTGKKS